jgi:hypothetical protein
VALWGHTHLIKIKCWVVKQGLHSHAKMVCVLDSKVEVVYQIRLVFCLILGICLSACHVPVEVDPAENAPKVAQDVSAFLLVALGHVHLR